MSKFLIGGSIFATIISAASFIAVIFGVDPDDSTWWHFSIFYASMLLTMVGCLFLVFIYLRNKLKKPVLMETLHHPFRQSVFISGFVVGLMILHQFNRLNIISLVALVVFSVALEIYFVRIRN
jgi:MFS family permease